MKKVQKIDWEERAPMIAMGAILLAYFVALLLLVLFPLPKGRTIQDLTRSECGAINGEWHAPVYSAKPPARIPSKCFLEDAS